MVYEEDIGMSIYYTSESLGVVGHLAGFSDPLVDCLNCKERFRADKAQKDVGEVVKFRKNGKSDGEWLEAAVTDVSYVCPHCGGPNLSKERWLAVCFAYLDLWILSAISLKT